MISPQNRQVETAVPTPEKKRMAFTISVILAATLAILMVVSQLLLRQHSQTLSIGWLQLVAVAAALLNLWFIHRDRVMLGTGVLAVAFFSIIALITTQIEGLGLFLNVNATTILIVLLIYSWPHRWLGAGVAATAVTGVALALIDLYWPGARQSFPSFLYPVYYAAVGIVVVLVAVLIGRQFKNYSLRGKLIVTFLAITGIPLVALATGNFLGLRGALTDSANQTLLSASSQTAVTLDDFFYSSLDTIRAQATIMGTAYDWAYYSSLSEEERVGPVGTLAEEKAINLLIAYRNRDPENIASYALLDTDGQVLFEYPRNETKANEAERSYFTEVMESSTVYASPVEFLPETGQPYFHFSAVVVDGVGKRVGVLRARYHADFLQQLIERSTGLVGGESFAVLFDENDLHLAHGAAPETLYKLVNLPTMQEITTLQDIDRLPDKPPAELTTNLPKLAQHLKFAASTPVFEAVDVGEEERINQVGVAFMETQPWKVAYFQPKDIFLAPENTFIRHTVLLTLFALGTVAGVATAVANLIAQPILQLEQVANKVAQGDLSAQAPEFLENEAGALARTFNMMTAQLRDLIANLEHRVAERTRALEISSQVSQRLSTILNRQDLVTAVVNQVQEAFDYYHVHIYLFDEEQKNLLLVGGTGEAGEKMLQQGHKISFGNGLVGRAGEMNTPILVADVSQEPDWLPNPLLPDTQAEAAVPIASGERVLGVLDVQESRANGLDDSDVELLRLIANQMAIALENARLYEQTQEQVTRETLINEINQKIVNTTTMEEAMQVAVRELGRATGAAQTRVKLKTNGHRQA